jgi:hypothetical protein
MLRKIGYSVYDFRLPEKRTGFAWQDLGRFGNNDLVPPETYLTALDMPLARQGFASDFDAMRQADTCVLVLPCERDAHLELGWFAGQGKRTIILLDTPVKPSLMYLMCDFITDNLGIAMTWLIEQDGPLV